LRQNVRPTNGGDKYSPANECGWGCLFHGLLLMHSHLSYLPDL
jgi:hypothetical protein